MKKIWISISMMVSFAVIIVFSSCGTKSVFNQNQKIENNVWVRDQTIEFEPEIKDTATKYDVFIDVRHAEYYPYANLVVELNMIFPSGEERVKEHDLLIRNPDASFKGEAGGDIWDYSVPVYKNHTFNAIGKYKFSIRNVMPVHETPGLMEIGLTIKKAK